MSAIIDFLVGLCEIIESLFAFVFGIIGDLLYVIGLMASIVVRLGDMLGWLPGPCITLVVTTFGIVVIYKVLGREG